MAPIIAPTRNPYAPQVPPRRPETVRGVVAPTPPPRRPDIVPAAKPIRSTMAPIAYAQSQYEEPGDPFTAAAMGWINAGAAREEQDMEEAKRQQAGEALAAHPDLQKFVSNGVMDIEDAMRISADRDEKTKTSEAATARKAQITQRLTELGFDDLASDFTSGLADEDSIYDQVEKRLNPETEKPTEDQRELAQINKEREKAGQPPLSLEEFLSKKPSGTTVNVGPTGIDYGDPGAGLVWKRDPEGKILLDERGAPEAIPFKGGKAYDEAERRRLAEETKDERSDLKANVVVQDIDRALQMIEKDPLLTTGPLGQATQDLGGTPARDVKGLISTVRANAGFAELQAMREASPTGGALGSITERELAYLQSTIGDLEQSQTDGQLKDNLKRVKNAYLDIIHGPGNGPPREELSFETSDEEKPAPDAEPVAITSDEDYDALESGTLFKAPDGTIRKKP